VSAPAPVLTRALLHAYRDALRSKLQELDAIRTTCRHCAHFSDGRTCAKFQAAPPVDFQAAPDACEAWEYDGIPF